MPYSNSPSTTKGTSMLATDRSRQGYRSLFSPFQHSRKYGYGNPFLRVALRNLQADTKKAAELR
jgi:hypothetical protein